VNVESGEIIDGCCEGAILKSIELADSERDALLRMNDEIVVNGQVDGNTNKYQGGGKGQKRGVKNTARRKEDWGKFKVSER